MSQRFHEARLDELVGKIDSRLEKDTDLAQDKITTEHSLPNHYVDQSPKETVTVSYDRQFPTEMQKRWSGHRVDTAGVEIFSPKNSTKVETLLCLYNYGRCGKATIHRQRLLKEHHPTRETTDWTIRALQLIERLPDGWTLLEPATFELWRARSETSKPVVVEQKQRNYPEPRQYDVKIHEGATKIGEEPYRTVTDDPLTTDELPAEFLCTLCDLSPNTSVTLPQSIQLNQSPTTVD